MQASAVGEPDNNIVMLETFRQRRRAGSTATGVFLEPPPRASRSGEACITYDYTGTDEAAILSLPGILLVRDGRHYRSFRCCGPGPDGQLIKSWNVVEQATGIDTVSGPRWTRIHRFISELTELEARLKEIDAHLGALVNRGMLEEHQQLQHATVQGPGT